ncbi:KAP family P-loop NTPase fold protein [Candidatus Absconditicoccus praedator]|uniref:KAP family P-loop NTPase fold protein n=1 Tax=Candidatus Absconditicoccus praedator TaxID=2735562 RepID=UPI001E37DAF0|nr:P-loop NTPase fold protein [Candidatus Absconditicoccus praedator]UFX82621.1 hypothetical protein HLG78_00510 [Candidatus Absconditicoccus praedator]
MSILIYNNYILSNELDIINYHDLLILLFFFLLFLFLRNAETILDYTHSKIKIISSLILFLFLFFNIEEIYAIGLGQFLTAIFFYGLFFIIVFNVSGVKSYNNGLLVKSYKIENRSFDQFFDTYLNLLNEKGNFINPIFDEPISIDNDDIFGINDIVQNLYNIILGIDFNNQKGSYSIGIVGEWGSGKSSIINYLKDKYLFGSPTIKTLEFNPWNYEKDDLINKFFTELSIVLGKSTNLNSSIKKYLKALGELHSSFNAINSLISSKSINEIKKDLNNELNNSGKKIIVIIDDLDRCDPYEILLMLNLIKNLGDLKNIIYLVSYDKGNITKVLDDKGFDGNYIEKIINIERFVPVFTQEQKKKYFKNELKNILGKLFFNKIILPLNFDKWFESLYVQDVYISKKANAEIREKWQLAKREPYYFFKYLDEFNSIVNINLPKTLLNYKKLYLNKPEKIVNTLLNEFDKMLEVENLRFIKKLLNQLNIVLQLNLSNNTNMILDFHDEDYKKIIAINYFKLKNYSKFNYVIDKFILKEVGKLVDDKKIKRIKDDDFLINKDIYNEYFLNNILNISKMDQSNLRYTTISDKDFKIIKEFS